MDKRYFSLQEANELIPFLEKVFDRVTHMRAQVQLIYQRLASSGFAPTDDQFQIAPTGANKHIIDDLSSLKALLEEIRQQINSLTDLGCLLKDFDMGLIDFYSQKDGQDIFLCWKYGEKKIMHWHGVDEGYANRKRLYE